MNTLRNVVLWAMMVMGVSGCREMRWPVEPGSEEIVIRTITTDVQRGGAFSIEGQNLDRLAGQGQVVFYEGQNIRLPMQPVIANTLFGCMLPDSVRSGRMRIENGDGSILMDTLLNVYGDSTASHPSLLQSILWNQWQRMREAIEPILVDQNSRRYPWTRHPYESQVHTLRLEQWPFTQSQDGVAEVEMPGRTVDEDEYDCSYSCTKTTRHSSYTEGTSFQTAKPSVCTAS